MCQIVILANLALYKPVVSSISAETTSVMTINDNEINFESLYELSSEPDQWLMIELSSLCKLHAIYVLGGKEILA